MTFSSLVQSHDFAAFLRRCFASVAPGQTYLANWHIEMIGDYLRAVEHGEIRRLMVNVPPRSLKSVCVSVAWPAWLLGREPATHIIAASYAQTLAVKHSMDCRLVMQSEWFGDLFPDARISREQNEKHKFLTTRRGMRLATSIWGAATGEGGNILIADDPINPLQARSHVTRKFVNDWFDHTFSTRLNDKKRGVIVVVMQRLHADDVCGHLLHKGGWELLRLPAVAQQDETWEIGNKIWSRKRGELLHSARENAALIERAKVDLGSANFAAQYQQQPLRETGGMIKLEWFERF